MRMVRWMCGIKVEDRFPSKELRERTGIDDIISLLQQNRLQWYGHVLRKEDDDWVKKCMEYKVEGHRPRGRPKRTWREVVREDCQASKLNKEDAIDRCKWRKMIKDVRYSGLVWVGECFFWYRPTRIVPDQRLLNGCVCVCARARALLVMLTWSCSLAMLHLVLTVITCDVCLSACHKLLDFLHWPLEGHLVARKFYIRHFSGWGYQLPNPGSCAKWCIYVYANNQVGICVKMW